jgi:hypothetical protein
MKASRRFKGIWGVLALGLLPGCVHVKVSEQGQVSKPNMTFADTAAFGYDSALVCQVEPGAATSGGAQAAGCTSCK